jgi:hypothetical protein
VKASQQDLDLEGMPSTKHSVLAYLLLVPERQVCTEQSTSFGCLKVAVGITTCALVGLGSTWFVENQVVNVIMPALSFVLFLLNLPSPPKEEPPDDGNARLKFRKH